MKNTLSTATEKQKTIALEVVTFLFTNPFNNLSFTDIAKKCKTNKTFLECGFQLVMKKTITQVRREIMLQAAAARLLEGVTVKEVSIDCRYSSVSAFGKEFKKLFGHSPTDYIRIMKI